MSKMSDLALSRASDPETSVAAARSVDSAVTRMELAVWNYIRSRGDTGATWHEIATGTGIDPASVSPRLKPLTKKGMIRAKKNEDGTVAKRRSHSHRFQIIWISV